MPISHKHKIIFIHIPKAGGSSIEKAFGLYGSNNKGDNAPDPNIFYGIENGKALQHLTALEIKDKIPENIWNAYFKFSFVRNPFDRLVSEYSWRLEKLKKNKIPNISFSEFLDQYLLPAINGDNTDTLSDHFKLQTEFLFNQDALLVDFVGRLENFNEDFKTICQKIGVKIKLPHENKTRHQDCQRYYNDETKKIVSKIYQKDLEKFNYSF
ncbi:MAG: sulfotransferase family 2 domain-containing protein [Patescibacteria group bacterium]